MFVPDTLRTIVGRIGYLATGPDFGPRMADGRTPIRPGFIFSTLPGPAPRIPVEVRAPDDTLLGTGTTDDAGNYSINVNFGKNPATQVRIATEARLDLPGAAVRVYPDEIAALPYRHSSPLSGTPSDRTMRVDLNIEIADGAAAYHIINSLTEGFYAGHSGFSDLPDLDVYWKDGNGAVSSFRVDGNRGKLTVAGGVAGDEASNTDCWDGPKLMRLLGEYFLAFFYHDVDPPGTANEALLVPSAAWHEGFLDWFACHGRGSREYWDSEGLGASGHLIRYFDIESFFDPALGSLGPGDPNVYQDPSVIGIGSRFTVAEMLWDLHDANDRGTDGDGAEFPVFLTFQFLAEPQPGSSYPYLFTFFDRASGDGSLDPVTIDILTRVPEDQGMSYPATASNGLFWPTPVSPSAIPGEAVSPPFTKTVSDVVDTVNPAPANLSIGLYTQRYFLVTLAAEARITATVTSTGTLLVDILDLNNQVLATGPSPVTTLGLESGGYVIRVRSAQDPQVAPFDLRIDATSP